jgi:predicted unusual protein kinase regulating ubiquinone biosynthesis (AarF/ABC1/UbiB family)
MKYNVNNIDEVYIMNMITNNVLLKSLSRHFLMIYGSCVCSKRIAKKLKLISINELADGDLKMLTGMSDVLGDTELMFNLFIQTYISIATFQNLVGFTHRDTHFGNFLYQQNNEKGYYHYIFKGNDYYLKSCKYNIMIYDYGFARKIKVNEENEYDEEAITKKKNDIYDDYRKIIFSFITKKNGGWIKTSNIPSYKYANYKMIEIGNILDKYFDYELTYNIEYSTDDFTSLLFTHIIDNVFLKYAPKNLFITQRPPNVINAIPFRID